MALPENTVLSSAAKHAESSIEAVSAIERSLKLWDEGEVREALSLAESAYQTEDRAEIGYQYGLMLEASREDERAAEIYSETAIIQLQKDMFDLALRTLRRLDRLNETNSGKFDSQLTKALEFVKQR